MGARWRAQGASYDTDSRWARKLDKSHLGGVIFHCTNHTMKECLAKQLFGLSARHFVYVRLVEEHMPLFLFNNCQRKIYGIFEAASSGQMNIDPYAWPEYGSCKTLFPAQVRVRTRLLCHGIPEVVFKPVIKGNYYTHIHFWSELDHVQARNLIAMFSSPVIPRPLEQNFPKLIESVRPPPNIKTESSIEKLPDSEDDLSNFHGLDERALILEKLKEIAGRNVLLEAEETACTTSTYDEDLASEDDDQDIPASSKSAIDSDSQDYQSIIDKLCLEIENLKAFKHEQIQKVECVEKKLAEKEKKIRQLKNRNVILENLLDPIFLVGGYDGENWSSSFSSFSVSHDSLKSLKPLSTIRSYAAAAKINDEIYLFGGGDGSSWHDTVESYNAAKDEWTFRPSLNKPKGSLGGASVGGIIYAVGGGNGIDCFSEVEMFDPNIGRWIYSCSMLQKRFAVAAVELNGAIYAAGGFDGRDYLRSAERMDPREKNWSKIGAMHSKRGCHQLVTMNDKLYALGGYDGAKMVATVEVYDPRAGKWTSGKPMNEARGYFSAAVLNNTIYAIGGVQTDQEIVEKIDCYKEGGAWEETNLSAVGKRCFASAIV